MGWGDNDQGPWGKKPPTPSNDIDELDDLLKKGQEKFKDFMPGSGNFLNTPKSVLMLILAAIALWLASGFYILQPDEEGVVLRFGEYHRTAGAGLNYAAPFPFEKVAKIKVTTINREEIGYRSTTARRNANVNRYIPEESLMLTGDENIVDINFEVQWRIKNARNYLFNVRDVWGESTVKSAAESAMREVIGRTPIASALADGRLAIEQETKTLLQDILNSYEMGIEIVRLQMLKADPPSKVIDAFRDVQTARADKEREINQAEAYRNDIIPRARGMAEKEIQESKAYKGETVARAEGEANRFLAVYQKYRNAKSVTKKRMHLEAMEEILNGMDKVILGTTGTQGVLPYLPLPELNKKAK